MPEFVLLDQLTVLLEKGGLPTFVAGILVWFVWLFRGKRDDTETKMTAAFIELTTQMKTTSDDLQEIKLTLADKFGRIETRLDHLERTQK